MDFTCFVCASNCFFLIIRKYDVLSLYRASIREDSVVDSDATERWSELRNTHKRTIF